MRSSRASDHEVVVVGAGVAGLSCAVALAERGIDVVVIEARDRTGGRLLSIPAWKLDDTPALDLGATWVWPDQSAARDATVGLGLGVFPQHTSGDALIEPPSPDGIPLVQRLRGNPIEAPAYRLTSGAQSLADGLAARLASGTIRFSRPVTAISSDRAGVRVEVGIDELHADQVILAVPPALAVATIAFTPSLPQALSSLARATPVWMAHAIKIVACYDRPFWRHSGLAGAALSHPGPMREIHDMSGPTGYPATLFGFVTGAARPTGLHLGEQALQQLVRLFGAEAAHPIELHLQDWRAEQYTNPPGPDIRTDYRLFGDALYQHPTLSGRLHWASTETATAHAGLIEGALRAAERATTAVLERRSPTYRTTAKFECRTISSTK